MSGCVGEPLPEQETKRTLSLSCSASSETRVPSEHLETLNPMYSPLSSGAPVCRARKSHTSEGSDGFGSTCRRMRLLWRCSGGYVWLSGADRLETDGSRETHSMRC